MGLRGCLIAGAATVAALVPVTNAAALPAVDHVFVIVLENKGYAETFGPSSKAPYLARTLTGQGQLLSNYYGIGHLSLDNYIAMVSGQGPNILTQADCPLYIDVLPGLPALDGQVLGQGCVYPRAVRTIADQLTARGLTWKAYMQDMGSNCRHPAPNTLDGTQNAKVGDQYAARHNPFVYFHSLLDSGACAARDVPLGQLPTDLAAESTTPSYSFITPNLCEDGHDSPCVDHRPGGLASADAFLRTWVPLILASPAYQSGGLLIITFDEAENSGASGDASSCCNEPFGPNTINNGGLVLGSGGGRTGTVLLSPFITPGTINATPYNHYSLLRSAENLFGLRHLGYAARPGLKPFGSDVFG
jgi:hypothetical protein